MQGTSSSSSTSDISGIDLWQVQTYNQLLKMAGITALFWEQVKALKDDAVTEEQRENASLAQRQYNKRKIIMDRFKVLSREERSRELAVLKRTLLDSQSFANLHDDIKKIPLVYVAGAEFKLPMRPDNTLDYLELLK